jgi:hypothetical protein
MFSQTKRIDKLFLYLLIISGLGIFSGCSDMSSPVQNTQVGGILNQAATNRAAISRGKVNTRKILGGGRMLGDYAATIENGWHINTPAMIRQLKKLHINTYFYLIHHGRAEWPFFRKKFMPAAQKAGINVFVYLSSPTAALGARDPYPYGTDYVHWAKIIAQLSLKYSRLKGWTIGDFTSNLHTFTPSYLRKMQKAAHKINPKLIFSPTVKYYYAKSPRFHQKYGSYLGGILVPYLRFYDLKQLPGQLDQITKVWPSKRVALMVYATKHSMALNPPSAHYVRKALQIGLNYKKHGKLAGVLTYKLRKNPHKTTCGNLKHVLQFTVNYNTPTKAGEYVEASQKVRLNPAADHYRISFWQQDGRKASSTRGYHIKQFLVNGHAVWHKDVTGDSDKSRKVSLDLTRYLKGKSSARIAFRLYEKRGVSNFEVRVTFKKIQGHGFHVANNGCSDWAFHSKGSDVHRTHQCHECNHNREMKMFDAVKKLYGSWSER